MAQQPPIGEQLSAHAYLMGHQPMGPPPLGDPFLHLMEQQQQQHLHAFDTGQAVIAPNVSGKGQPAATLEQLGNNCHIGMATLQQHKGKSGVGGGTAAKAQQQAHHKNGFFAN